MTRLLIVTDAWHPQTNGVVTTWRHVVDQLPGFGVEPIVIHPGDFHTIAMPGYREIRLATDPWRLADLAECAYADAVHIVTEGPLGMAARRWCKRTKRAFSTSVHTKFPEYVADRSPLPPSVGYAFLRWFHRPSTTVLAMSPSHAIELRNQGLHRPAVWLGGVDTDTFRPAPRTPRNRPRLLYVGRVAVEKNLAAFLQLSIDADKVVVGDGPHRAELQSRFPDAHWLGYQYGDALAAQYAEADVLVFPSRTDTYGLVMLEANASGTPVAAYPVTGPKDLVRSGRNGCLHEDLTQAIRGALKVSPADCRAFAMTRNWQASTAELLEKISISAADQTVRDDAA